jgi:GWxTD domain-containing protein
MHSFRSRAALFLIVLLAQTAPAQIFSPKEPLRLLFDVARFRGSDDQRSMVELYYAFPRLGLTYKIDSAGFSGAGDVTVWVRQRDSVVQADRWLVPHRIQDTTQGVMGTNLVGVHTFQVPRGEYQIKVLVRDRHDVERKDSVMLRLPVKVHGTVGPELSDVELAASIRQGAEAGTFYKNTLEVVPNVGGMYSADQRVFYYSEAYNLLSGDDRSDYSTRLIVQDAIGKEVLSRERIRKRVGESSVIVDQFSVSSLHSGTYQLILALMDSSKRMLGSAARKFYVYNPKLGVDSSLLAGSSRLPMTEYLAMDEAELDRESRWLRWEASEEEKNQFKALTGVDAKRKFLSDFWRKRPLGLRDEYLARVNHANMNFAVMGREGYRADRGRVHIVYGSPDDIERHPNETDSRPYEIWSYNNIQGGVIFVFVQKNTGGDYELVHSTHRNELRDDNWDRVGVTR